MGLIVEIAREGKIVHASGTGLRWEVKRGRSYREGANRGSCTEPVAIGLRILARRVGGQKRWQFLEQ